MVSPSRTPFAFPSLALGYPLQPFLVDSYLFHSRHSRRVRDLSTSPVGGPQLTEISCDAPGRAAYVPSYVNPLIRHPYEWLSASHSHSLLAIGPRLSEDGLRHLNVRDVPFPAGCCVPLIRAFLTSPPLCVARSIIYDTYRELDENLACSLRILPRLLELRFFVRIYFATFLNPPI